jgi:hypothetical protein
MAGVERIIEGPVAVDAAVPDSALTRDQIIARNLKVVETHFHSVRTNLNQMRGMRETFRREYEHEEQFGPADRHRNHGSGKRE